MATVSVTSAEPRLGRGVWIAVVALVMFRSLVWVFWEQSYFNSDQAVIGLMGKHLSQLRALPLLFYGQHYMLAVEAWIAAPVFLLFGMSVATLKLPLVAINIAIGILLVRILVRDVGLSRSHAFVASLFFLLAPPVAASRLVEAQGGNVEPLLYTMLLWLTRAHPVAFGLIAGVGTMHREFTTYAVAAVFLLEAWHRTLFSWANLRAKAIVLGEMAAIVWLVRFLMPKAALLGPGTAGTFPANVAEGQMRFWLSRFCWDPAAVSGNLAWLFNRNLATLFGWRTEPLAEYVRSSIASGHVWALAALMALGVGAVVAVFSRRAGAPAAARAPRPAVLPGRAFPVYLAIVGLMTLGVYALLSCGMRDPSLVRYTLLGLLIPVAITAAVLRVPGARVAKGIAIAGVLVWAASAGLDNMRVLVEYIRHPPHNDYRELADRLEKEGVRYGRGGYWTVYHIDFLTTERVILASNEKVRIKEYENIVDQHENESAAIYFDDPCKPTEDGINFGRWCIGYITRARHPVGDRPKNVP